MSEHPWIKRGPYPGPEHTGMPIPDDPVVGHATFRDGHHEPIRKSEAEAIMAASERAKALRAEQMPDERSAIETMFSAWLRLKELGWKEAMYCPKDTSWFSVIEAGSTGIHRAQYQGEWPTGTCWIADEGDLWPSRPVLWKPLADDQPSTEVSSTPAAQSEAQKCSNSFSYTASDDMMARLLELLRIRRLAEQASACHGLPVDTRYVESTNALEAAISLLKGARL